MDYSFFINKTSSILLDNGFYEGPVYNNEHWYLKIMPPVLYAIHITNSSNFTKDNTYISYTNKLYEKLKDCHCGNLVSLNIVFSTKITNDNESEFFSNYSELFDNLEISQNIHNVYWVFSAYEERLLFPKGQPTKLNGIELYFNWKKYEKSETSSIRIYDNKPYITYAVIVINVLIWAYINLKGRRKFYI